MLDDPLLVAQTEFAGLVVEIECTDTRSCMAVVVQQKHYRGRVKAIELRQTIGPCGPCDGPEGARIDREGQPRLQLFDAASPTTVKRRLVRDSPLGKLAVGQIPGKAKLILTCLGRNGD